MSLLTAKRNQPHTRATLRQRWEYAHAGSALLNFAALVALLEGLLGPAGGRLLGRGIATQGREPPRRLELQEVER